MAIATLPLRDPARIAYPGTFPHPDIPGCRLTYGHDAVLDVTSEFLGRPWVAVDIETEGLGLLARNIKVVTISDEHHAVLYDIRDPAQYDACKRVLVSVGAMVFHNSPFDVPPIAHNRLLQEKDAYRVTDTLIYARVANPDEKGDRSLANCARTYLGWEVKDGIAARAKNLGITKSAYFLRTDLDSPGYRRDAAADAIATARLYPVIRQRAFERITTGHPFTKYGLVGDEAWTLVDREQRINRMFLARTIKGIRWDPEYLDNYRGGKASEMAQWVAELERQGIRPGVADDLTQYLHNRGELPADWPTTDTGKFSGAKGHLESLGHPLTELFLRHKQTLKVDRDYLSKVADLSDDYGRIHPVVNVLGASATGRMSYGNPPLQQFDKDARGILLAEPGDVMVSIDWSQIEPVTAANLAGDHQVLARYEDETLTAKERDTYLGIADFAGITRDEAKVVLLAQMYGQGLTMLATNLGLLSAADAGMIRQYCDQHDCYPGDAADALGLEGFHRAAEVRDMVMGAMPETAKLIKKLKKIGEEYGVIITVSGRVLPIPMATYKGRTGRMTHKAVNYFVQGSAYDLLAETLIRVMDAGLGEAVYLAMHDELVVSREAAEDVRRIMSTPPDRLVYMAGRVPILRTDMADLGERWAKC